MLRRLLKLRMAIESLQVAVNPQQKEDKAVADKLMKLRLKTWSWEEVEQLVSILKPFEGMALFFSSTSSGIAACIAPWVVGLLSELDKEDVIHSKVLNQFSRTSGIPSR